MADLIQLTQSIYDSLAKGDYESAAKHIGPDSKWHILGLGVELEGRDSVVEFVKGLYSKGFQQKIVKSCVNENVVACFVDGVLPNKSNYRSCVVHVYHGEQILEYTAVRTSTLD